MWLQIISLLFAHGILTQAVTLVARISVGGVKGTVTFIQSSSGGDVTVAVDVSGPNVDQAKTWQLHTHRLNYDVIDRCDDTQLGPRILQSVGGTVSNATLSGTGLELSGINSIEGRSIALLNDAGDSIACATVESTQDYITAHATFRKNVLGRIIFRQLKTPPPSSLTRVLFDLYSDGSESSVRDLEWRIVEAAGCNSLGTAFNPESVSGVCSNADHTSCAVGDVQGKLGNVSVGVTMGTERRTWADLNLPLSGSATVLGKTVQLYAGGQSSPVACATITAYTTTVGVATFDNDGVTGTITVTQPSPLDPATTAVDLKNLRSKAGGYHVHKYPVPQRMTKDQSMCGNPSVAGHFNPFGIIYNSNSPAAGASTEDMYEVGDLSKKYGLLSGSDSKTQTYTDFNLPLFGVNSVLGRSIVIHYDQPGTPRWVCANLLDTAALTSVMATFTYPVIGHVLLQQRMGDEGADTTVYYRLDYADGVTGSTSEHSWAVHADPVGGDMLEEDVSARCRSAGDVVVNPMGVNAAQYDTQCQPSAPLRCKAGDLTGKHRPVSVRQSAGGTPAIGFFTDTNLPLQGSNSVQGSSLVLRASDGGSGYLACATLMKVLPQVAVARSWGEGADFGSITFSQQVGVVQVPTTIDVRFQSLSSYTSVSSTVGSRPVRGGGDDRCSGLGLYNPFEASSSGGSTKDLIPVGDLTAKFGPLPGSGGTVTGLTWVDPSLDVWGVRSVRGRAFYLQSSGSSLGCADIGYQAVPGAAGKLFTAKAVFSGEVVGTITLTQFVFKDGAMTPTTVIVDLRKANGTQTERHNWHTHILPVGDDAHATPGRCASTSGHYNPFRVNVTKSVYSECKLSNPLRCELGDQSNKLGTYDMGSGPMVVNDVYLPMTGPYGVVGRSIVVHTEQRGAPRLACADIMPAALTNSYTMHIKTTPTLDRTGMVEKIASVINSGTYDVAVEVLSVESDCTNTRIYFLGMDAEMYSQRFINVIGGDPPVLGMYQPEKRCATGSANVALMSLYLLLTSLAMGLLLG